MKRIHIPCLYWPNKQVTVLVDRDVEVSLSTAKKLAKHAFLQLRARHEEFKNCQLVPWSRLFDTKREALTWSKQQPEKTQKGGE